MQTVSHPIHLYLSLYSLSEGGSILPVLATKLETYFNIYINSSIYDLEDFKKKVFALTGFSKTNKPEKIHYCSLRKRLQWFFFVYL